MMTRADRRRFPILLAVIAALAMAMLFSPVQAQEGSAPDQPTGLTAEATHGQVVLTWDDPQDDSITGYVVLRRVRVNDTGGDFDVLVADTGTAALTYTDDTVAASLTYTYRIKAINEHGVSERSRWFHIDTPAAPAPEEEQAAEPPDQPTGLEATASHDSVTLTWDDTVAAETRYTYRIKAINGAGTSERSRWSHIDVPAAPVPDKPTGLEATESHGQVVLTWDDPGDASITGYVILRRVRENDTGGDFSVLVADTGTAATTYTYRIKALNEHGTSERSRWFHIDIPEAP